jgi:hypothetical protein
VKNVAPNPRDKGKHQEAIFFIGTARAPYTPCPYSVVVNIVHHSFKPVDERRRFSTDFRKEGGSFMTRKIERKDTRGLPKRGDPKEPPIKDPPQQPELPIEDPPPGPLPVPEPPQKDPEEDEKT